MTGSPTKTANTHTSSFQRSLQITLTLTLAIAFITSDNNMKAVAGLSTSRLTSRFLTSRLTSSRTISAVAIPSRTTSRHHQNQNIANCIGGTINSFTKKVECYSHSTKRMSAGGVSGSDIMASLDGDKGKEWEGRDVAGAMEALARADAVCFDVDSTVIQEEGIDVLAESLGKGEEVAAWTLKAMEGNTKFEDALAARLQIIQPSRASIQKCLLDHPLRLSPGIDRLVSSLIKRGTDVYLVSGGFRIMIEPVADLLSIPHHRIVANTILFDETTEEGKYVDFDREEPTSADMGKPRAVKEIKEEFGYQTVVMVGDGATDAQAKPPADAFVGFGGVAVREAVRDAACWYVRDFEDMIAVVENFPKK